METIQLQVPTELARRLQPYYYELPKILEWGLQRVEESDKPVTQRQLATALLQAGAIGPNPATIAQYLSEQENHPWTPIQAAGTPASETIIEERNSYLWAR